MRLSAGSMQKTQGVFRPSPGTITDMYFPGGKGIRIDSAVYSGYTIPPYYDSMIAKVIVWAKNRTEAILRCRVHLVR